jgi:hypothetical protein
MAEQSGQDEPGDQAWFDTLAGRAAADADEVTVNEAQAVRRALLASKPDAPAQDLESGVQKLLFRLRREGLDNAAPRRKSWQVYGSFALAASLMLAVGVVMLQSSPTNDIPIYRGGGAQTLSASDTVQLAAALSAEFEGLGIQPKVTRFGSTFTIAAEWPAKPDAKHTAFLKRHGLKQPASGPLVIELSPADKRQ